MNELGLEIPETQQVGALFESQRSSNQQTARRALRLLSEHEKYKGRLIVEFDNQFRNRLASAYALYGKIIYGKAFDAIILAENLSIISMTVEQLYANLSSFTLCEIKSTSRGLKAFDGYFFSVSTAEILVAQSLGENFKFIFVNVHSKEVREASLQDVYAHAKAIYPTWSITLKSLGDLR